MNVGDRNRILRENKGWEQQELADRIDISQSKMNKIETDFQKRIEPEILVDLSNVLGTTVDYIVGRSGDPNKTKDEEFEEFIGEVPGFWYNEAYKND